MNFQNTKKYENKNADTIRTVRTNAIRFFFRKKQTICLYGIVISRPRRNRLLRRRSRVPAVYTRAKISRTDNDKNSKIRRGTRGDKNISRRAAIHNVK